MRWKPTYTALYCLLRHHDRPPPYNNDPPVERDYEGRKTVPIQQINIQSQSGVNLHFERSLVPSQRSNKVEMHDRPNIKLKSPKGVTCNDLPAPENSTPRSTSAGSGSPYPANIPTSSDQPIIDPPRLASRETTTLYQHSPR